MRSNKNDSTAAVRPLHAQRRAWPAADIPLSRVFCRWMQPISLSTTNTSTAWLHDLSLHLPTRLQEWVERHDHIRLLDHSKVSPWGAFTLVRFARISA